ncbi:MAG: NAD(P)/FAD-dependent oxidoreductase [Ignavibacteriaceae bacterium]
MNCSQENYKVIVIGAGQAGLSAGYFLKKSNIPFIIVDAKDRVGDSWRNRWDSLRLFTPAKFNGLAGMKFPAPPNYFPTKNEMADYLESYAKHFNLPVKNNIKVDGLSREGDKYFITAGDQHFEAEHVVIAMSNYQVPKIPKFAKDLNSEIIQVHSSDYRNPSQLKEGPVLVVGAGNSGSELALEAAKNNYNVILAGRDTGHIPFDIKGTLSKLILGRLVLRILFHRIITINTPIGRKARPKVISQGGPLIRNKPEDFVYYGIKRNPKIVGVKEGLPVDENQQVYDINNVIWCTGFYPAYSWIDIACFNGSEPIHKRGIVENEPGLYFVGIHFLYSLSSVMIHGVERDAEYVVKVILQRLKSGSKQSYLKKN